MGQLAALFQNGPSARRKSLKDLQDKNIVGTAKVTSTLASRAKALEKNMKKDKLDNLLSDRPEAEELEEVGILKQVDEDAAAEAAAKASRAAKAAKEAAVGNKAAPALPHAPQLAKRPPALPSMPSGVGAKKQPPALPSMPSLPSHSQPSPDMPPVLKKRGPMVNPVPPQSAPPPEAASPVPPQSAPPPNAADVKPVPPTAKPPPGMFYFCISRLFRICSCSFIVLMSPCTLPKCKKQRSCVPKYSIADNTQTIT